MATATAPRLKDMMAVSKDSKVKKLGFITWYSTPDQDVSLRRLRRLGGLAGLPVEMFPKDIRAADAFKRTVRGQAGIKRDGSVVTETDVRDVLENSEDIIYQVTRVVRDAEERVVIYEAALRVWFSKVTGEIGYKPLGDVPKSEVLPIMQEIDEEFEAKGKTVTGAKVRSIVRNYIKGEFDEQMGVHGLSGEPLGGADGRRGAPYFVLVKFEAELESLSMLLEKLYEPEGRAYLRTTAMADGRSEREMVRAAHTANCVEEMEAAIVDAAKLLQGERKRDVRTNVEEFHWNRLAQFRRRAAQYADVLKEEQDEVNAKLGLLNKQLRKLTG
jgi:hypothetical protein